MLDALTLDQMRVLVAVADAGSFSAAARRLGRAQSAVSQSVQSLEDTLRLQLFDRATKLPRATEAGLAMIAEARRMLRGAEAMRARARAIAGGLEAELTVAVDPLLPLAAVMAALRALREDFPVLPVTVLTEGLGHTERHLHDGAVQLAFHVRVGDTELASEFLTAIEMVPTVAATHSLAFLPAPLSREALAAHVQLVLTEVSGDGARTWNVVSHQIWRFADMHTRLEFLLNGFGWCNMPLHLVQPHLDSGRLRRLRVQEQGMLSLPAYAVHEPRRPPGVAGRWLIGRLRAELAALGYPVAPPEAQPPQPTATAIPAPARRPR